jgi:hypothetical protein
MHGESENGSFQKRLDAVVRAGRRDPAPWNVRATGDDEVEMLENLLHY